MSLNDRDEHRFEYVHVIILIKMCNMCTKSDNANVTISTRCSFQNEIFASRHQDENSVACIEDRCYVLPLAQYCR